jgi:hypothetical protein
MKRFAFTGIASLAAFACLAPAPARAGDEVAAAIGGFIGGVIVGAHLGDREHRDHRPPPPVYDRRPGRGGHVVVVPDRHRDRGGYWDWREVRVWIPGRHETSFDHRGRCVRVWVPGYHEVRRERVWVDTRRRGSHRW